MPCDYRLILGAFDHLAAKRNQLFPSSRRFAYNWKLAVKSLRIFRER
jgi:hypothetical protein